MVELEKLLKNWRVVFLIVCLAGSLILIAPRYGQDGWTTNIQKGFDIQGGVRATLSPETTDKALIQDAMSILRTRMNVYGLKDIRVYSASDLTGRSYVIVEAAGLTKEDVMDVVAKQGLFEAKIANVTIFTGADVQVDSYKSGVQSAEGGYKFFVSLRVTNPEAAQKFADVTAGLSTEFTTITSTESYLNETLDLFLDGKPMDSLKIAASLKGRVFDTPVVEGGAAEKADALKKMEQMKAILQSGSLPIKFDIPNANIEQVSPTLGGVFLRNTLLAGLMAIAAVGLVMFIRYRTPQLTALIMMTVLSEILLVLGISVAIKWQLDVAAIAGIIVSVGTGVNQEIIMTDEFLFYGVKKKVLSFKEQIKNASFIIFAAFGTGISAMLPLVFIGLGAVRGFAITTIIGLFGGVFVTRPAYLVFLDAILSDRPASLTGEKKAETPKAKPEAERSEGTQRSGESPKAEPKAEPKSEPPKVETPKAEPKAEVHKEVASSAEAPKAEPKAEPAKPEQAKPEAHHGHPHQHQEHPAKPETPAEAPAAAPSENEQ